MREAVTMKRGSWLVLTMVLSAVALGLVALKTETAAAVDGEAAGAPGDCLVDRAGGSALTVTRGRFLAPPSPVPAVAAHHRRGSGFPGPLAKSAARRRLSPLARPINFAQSFSVVIIKSAPAATASRRSAATSS
jgi:hypothetical protein